ncbi:Hypothetical predicted protein, partial [Marmota monax]
HTGITSRVRTALEKSTVCKASNFKNSRAALTAISFPGGPAVLQIALRLQGSFSSIFIYRLSRATVGTPRDTVAF